MDFLDSLDLETTHKKTKRVRSWYLYEQFKSLENNQLEAAQKLKDRSYQERILRRELRERRARRRLYDEFGLCTIEPRTEKSITSEGTKTAFSASNDDFFESFCELEDDRISVVTERDLEDSDNNFSQDDSQLGTPYVEEFQSIEDIRNDNSLEESITSVVENLKSRTNLADDIKEELESVKKNIAENINMQMETVKASLQFIEDYTKLCDDAKMSSVESLPSIETRAMMEGREHVHGKNDDNNLFIVWSKLVSFAYQIIQLNHGNCYYDYGSQFLTAVLACDVLRRGINRMFNILQPYVSPIKFATDESETSSVPHKTVKRKISRDTKKYKNWTNHKLSHRNKGKKLSIDQKYNSEHSPKHMYEYQSNKNRWSSEPRHINSTFTTSKRDLNFSHKSSTIWPGLSREYVIADCNCYCHRMRNPMLNIGRYVDSILQDIEDCSHD
ncbi:uncharacterized protein LOC131852514 isoform X1 [Achroia grisella]|uniref:uncharacterized protein LOC131852514 isoform X1 n=1 Tax=Achroia grisella TaxID=688607 RepID=UPI0027D21D00|nr:uncharacterized protein LOC131852514 isoform X1 [Achroia grisella]